MFPMEKWVELLISWSPFLALFALLFWYARSAGMRARGKSGTTMIELYEQQVIQTRLINENLERIAAALEKRERPARG